MRVFAFAALCLALTSACDWVNRIDPAIKPLPGHLCSEVEITCYTGTRESGCCGSDDTCGGQNNVSCPAGSCCFVGGGDMMARAPYAQRLYSAP